MSRWVVESRIDQWGVREWGARPTSSSPWEVFWFRTHVDAFTYAERQATFWVRLWRKFGVRCG